jgi:hypothetical protein
VIDQQPDLELDAGQLRDRQPIDAFPQRGARDRDRVDPIGLPRSRAPRRSPAIKCVATLTTRSPETTKKRSKGTRDMPTVI